MKKVLFFLLSICILGAMIFGVWHFLGKKDSDTFKQLLSSADSMEIAFIDPSGKIITKKMITHQPQVWLFTGTIADVNATPSDKCVFGATVQLFSQGKPLFPQPAGLNFEPDCKHIAFIYKEKIYRKRILYEGIDYLEGLKDELLPKGNTFN